MIEQIAEVRTKSNSKSIKNQKAKRTNTQTHTNKHAHTSNVNKANWAYFEIHCFFFFMFFFRLIYYCLVNHTTYSNNWKQEALIHNNFSTNNFNMNMNKGCVPKANEKCTKTRTAKIKIKIRRFTLFYIDEEIIV